MIKSISFIVLTQFFHFNELKISMQPGYFFLNHWWERPLLTLKICALWDELGEKLSWIMGQDGVEMAVKTEVLGEWSQWRNSLLKTKWDSVQKTVRTL